MNIENSPPSRPATNTQEATTAVKVCNVIDCIPEEIRDTIVDKARQNKTPYKTIAAISPAVRQTAKAHAKRALEAAPKLIAEDTPFLAQSDWLDLTQTHQWLASIDSASKSGHKNSALEWLSNQANRLGPEALRASLGSWIASQPHKFDATAAAARIVKAYASGATILNLSWLNLSTLPESLGQLKQLQVLCANDNQLTAITHQIGQLENLQIVHLSNNQLTALPESIGQIKALQRIDVTNNQLIALPTSIGQLSALTVLFASRNRISLLPEEIQQLQSLRSVHLANNTLMVLPECMRRLTNLMTLDVRYNPLPTVSEEIVKQLATGGCTIFGP